MEEIGVVMRKFGDEQSGLLDQFERLSFEVKLNQAILARSLSEPCRSRPKSHSQPPPPPLPLPLTPPPPRKSRCRSRLSKFMRRLVKPVLGMACTRPPPTREAPKPSHDLSYCKAFSRSMRL